MLGRDEAGTLTDRYGASLRGRQVRCQRCRPERVYAGIEVSITANDDDVNRAADRAQILRKVTGGPVMAVVIADRVEAQQRELAARREVAVALHPE